MNYSIDLTFSWAFASSITTDINLFIRDSSWKRKDMRMLYTMANLGTMHWILLRVIRNNMEFEKTTDSKQWKRKGIVLENSSTTSPTEKFRSALKSFGKRQLSGDLRHLVDTCVWISCWKSFSIKLLRSVCWKTALDIASKSPLITAVKSADKLSGDPDACGTWNVSLIFERTAWVLLSTPSGRQMSLES